jgi:regulatory protein
VNELAARGYVDDAAFARRWVEQRAARGYGTSRLRGELRARGVAPSLVDAALTALSGTALLATARAAAHARWARLRHAPAERRAARLRDHLRRRGFPGGLVARVVRETIGHDPDGDVDA